MRSTQFLLLLIAATTHATVAAAKIPVFADSRFAFATGAGAKRCSEWVSDIKVHAERGKDIEWLLGYLSAANALLSKSEERKLLWPSDDPSDYIAYIDCYCRRESAKIPFEAAKAVTIQRAHTGGL